MVGEAGFKLGGFGVGLCISNPGRPRVHNATPSANHALRASSPPADTYLFATVGVCFLIGVALLASVHPARQAPSGSEVAIAYE